MLCICRLWLPTLALTRVYDMLAWQNLTPKEWVEFAQAHGLNPHGPYIPYSVRGAFGHGYYGYPGAVDTVLICLFWLAPNFTPLLQNGDGVIDAKEFGQAAMSGRFGAMHPGYGPYGGFRARGKIDKV